MISVDTYRLLGPFNINLGDFASYALFFPLNVFNDVSLCCICEHFALLSPFVFCVFVFVIYLHHHLKSSNPLWSESLSLSVSAVIGWELGTRQTSLSSFSGTFFISFFFAALFNNVSFCYYTSLCVPLSSRWVFLCHFGVIPYLWWFYWVILSLGLFWRDILVLMNIFDWVLSSFRFYHYSAVRVSLYAVAKSLSLY